MPIRKNVSIPLEREIQRYVTPEAKRFALCEWYRYMFPYIPFRTGLLASTTDMSGGLLSPNEAMQAGLEGIQDNIHFKAPYASQMYSGESFNFSTDLHPLAQARWAEIAADLHGEQIAKKLKAFIKRSEK